MQDVNCAEVAFLNVNHGGISTSTMLRGSDRGGHNEGRHGRKSYKREWISNLNRSANAGSISESRGRGSSLTRHIHFDPAICVGDIVSFPTASYTVLILFRNMRAVVAVSAIPRLRLLWIEVGAIFFWNWRHVD